MQIEELARLLDILRSEPRLAVLTDDILSQLQRLTSLLQLGQQRMNLTSITDPLAIARLHYADSLAALDAEPAVAAAGMAADIGSGAGFPLLPLAIMNPQCHWTALESVAKKAKFIEETAEALALGNVTSLAVRAEDAGRGDQRETFEIVTARAVGAIASLCEVGLPLLKHGGTLLLYKTAVTLPELDKATAVLRTLGGEALPCFRYSLEGDQQDRIIIRIRKTGPTPARYPRHAGTPFKKPLE